VNGQPAIEIKGLTAGYDGEPIVTDVDLTIEQGEFFGLIGPNGGGKSTLLKVMLGLLKPMKGSVRVFGEPPARGREHLSLIHI
jgi:zinc transport system ATP-binding protein